MVGQAWFRRNGSTSVPGAEQPWAEEGKMSSEGWGQGLPVKNVDSVLGEWVPVQVSMVGGRAGP